MDWRTLLLLATHSCCSAWVSCWHDPEVFGAAAISSGIRGVSAVLTRSLACVLMTQSGPGPSVLIATQYFDGLPRGFLATVPHHTGCPIVGGRPNLIAA